MKRVSFAAESPRKRSSAKTTGGSSSTPKIAPTTAAATTAAAAATAENPRRRFSQLSVTVVSALRFARRFRDGVADNDAAGGRHRSASAVGLQTRRASGFDRLRRAKRDPSSLGDVDEDGSGAGGRRAGGNKNAIFNEEIARLRIREEDLVKISQEARAASGEGGPEPETFRRVAVAREIPESLRRPRLRRVALLRRKPIAEATAEEFQDDEDGQEEDKWGGEDTRSQLATARSPQTSLHTPDEWRASGGRGGGGGGKESGAWQPPRGPQLDKRGQVVPHSLLGRPEEFYRFGLARGHLRPEDVPQAYRASTAIGDAPENERHRDFYASRSANPAGTGADYQQIAAFPALTNGPEADLSAREYNRQLLCNSSRAMRRLTEQAGQCERASMLRRHQISSRLPPQSPAAASQAWSRQARPRSALADPAAGGASSAEGPRLVRLSGPMFSFIGGWSYQKQVLLG